MLNKIIVMGRLVHSPQLRNTESGLSVASFTLACDRDYKDQNGKRAADFIDIVAWRQRADFAAKYFAKGQAVVVEGRLQSRDYVDRNKNKRRAWEIIAENLYFAGSRPEDAHAADAPPPPSDDDLPPAFSGDESKSDRDLPF